MGQHHPRSSRDLLDPIIRAMERAGLNPDPQTLASSADSSSSELPRSMVTQLRGPRRIVAAGIEDDMVDVGRLTEKGKRERFTDILMAIAHLEDLAQHRAEAQHRAALARKLFDTPYTIRQIVAAAELVAAAETYGHPLSWQHWHTAFAQPTISAQRVAELRNAAWRDGYDAARKELDDAPASPEVVRAILDPLKENLALQEENARLARRLAIVKRERDNLQRLAGIADLDPSREVPETPVKAEPDPDTFTRDDEEE